MKIFLSVMILFLTALACDHNLGPKEVELEYSVTGSTTIAKEIEYCVPGTSNYIILDSVTIPWSLRFTARKNQYVYLRAFKEDSTTTMTVSILRNGVILQSTTITRFGGDTVADVL